MDTKTPTPPWRLVLFNEVSLVSGEHRIVEFETKRSAKLLVLLSCSRTGTMRRDELADLLWPDDFIDSTRLRLRQELSRLRRALGDSEDMLSASPESVSLDRSRIFNDWDLLASPQNICPNEMLEILSGPYLPGWDDLWVLARKAEADSLRISVAQSVIQRLYDLGSLSEAKEISEAAQKLDPKNEFLRDTLMKIHADQGSLSQALATYRLVQRSELPPPANETEAPIQAERVSNDLPPVPHPIDRFHGRSRQIQDIANLLNDSQNRLVTLVGPGGIGKTRLAIESVKGWSDPASFISFVECSAEVQPIQYLADKIFHNNGATHPISALRQRLSNDPTLLILDNLETLEDPGLFVTELLSNIPNIRLLVTSRRPMRVAGENLIQVGPLDKSEEGLPMLEGLIGSHRQSVEQSQALSEIVDLCDAIPLTLRLAASRLRTMEPKELVEELTQTISTLTAQAADLPERHRNLERMLELSLQSLSEEDQQILREIACFPGGVTRTIVRSKVGREVDAVLDRLLDSSLLWLDDEVSPLRFGMLEPVRQYLRQSESTETYSIRQANFVKTMVNLAQSFQHVLALPPDEDRLAYKSEATNFRTALQLGIEQDAHLTFDLFSKIWNWELTAGRSNELLTLTDRFLETTPVDSAMLGHIKLARAWCHSIGGDLVLTSNVAKEAKDHFLEAKMPAEACYSDLLSHECKRNFLPWREALEGYERIVTTAQSLNIGLVATARVWRGRAYVHRCEWDLARQDLEFGYQISKDRQHLSLQIAAGITLMYVDYALGNRDQLAQRIAEMERTHLELDDSYSWSIFYRAVSRFELANENLDRAEVLAEKSNQKFGFAENSFQEVEYRVILARIWMKRKDSERARKFLIEVSAYIDKVLPRVQIPALAALAEYYLLDRKTSRAIEVFSKATWMREVSEAGALYVDMEYVDQIQQLVGSPKASPLDQNGWLSNAFRELATTS